MYRVGDVDVAIVRIWLGGLLEVPKLIVVGLGWGLVAHHRVTMVKCSFARILAVSVDMNCPAAP